MAGKKSKKRIAILGGGPSCLFVYKRLVESKTDCEIDIFERKKELGLGMPYSAEGASTEHITNVSANEIPDLIAGIEDWIKTLDEAILKQFHIDPDHFTKYHVMPRLLFGRYLSSLFEVVQKKAKKLGIVTRIHLGCEVTDVIDQADQNKVQIEVAHEELKEFDAVVICTGHIWPVEHEGTIPGYYDSPYPPSKLKMEIDHPVAIKGASLTAIDAVRTLARQNGSFQQKDDGKLLYVPKDENSKFRIVLHSRNGLLPAIRFHLEEPQLSRDSLLTKKEIDENRAKNGGFLSLDFLFDENFKKSFRQKDPKFYRKISSMNIERFVEAAMAAREGKEPFQLFREEYAEAEKSIREKESIYWKEMLAELSYTMNYPAKYLSAEDMLRLKKVLMPLIAVVIAFVPQSSCAELLALNDAGRLTLVAVDADSKVVPKKEGGVVYKFKDEQNKAHAFSYKTFVNSVGQPHLNYRDLPFRNLLTKKTVSQAMLRFKSAEEARKQLKEGNDEVVQNANGDYFLKVTGVTINDYFQVVNEYGIENERIFMMAVPYIGGYNPDYSGLDFSEEASKCIVEKLGELM
jgi:hypothetical protein